MIAMKAIQELKEKAQQDNKMKYPHVPEHARPSPHFMETTANGLTKCVLTWLTLNGHKAWRQSSEGRYRPGKQVTDVVGRTRLMKGQYIPGTNEGHGDVAAIIDGLFVAWEIKMKDKQSDKQKKFQQEVEQSGGKYFICRSFDDFMNQYRELIKNVEKP
jgi:hypothetical protein